MKPITKQLIIGAFILALVTVASLGIRHIRFSANRANTIESPVIAEAEPDHYPTDSHTVVAEPDPQYADALDSAEEAPSEDHSETKSFKGDYAKSKGSKGLEKISMGDNDNLYFTQEGELWYTSEQGSGSKARVEVDDNTGEITVIEQFGNGDDK